MDIRMKLYIDFRKERSETALFLASLLRGSIDSKNSRILYSSLLEYGVMDNPVFDSEKAKEFDGGFFHYKYYCEIDPIIDITDENLKKIKQELSELLLAIWMENIPAIISADFEDELPERGGYLSPNVPRPQ